MISRDEMHLLYSLFCCVSGNCDNCKYVNFGTPEDLTCQLELRKAIKEMMDKHMRTEEPK